MVEEKRNQAFMDERLRYIDWLLMIRGWFSRSDLMSRFKIQGAAASRDISRYKCIKPDNLFLNHKIKRYEVNSDFFEPINKIENKEVFSRLCDREMSASLGIDGPIIETMPCLTDVNDRILEITNAILNRYVISVIYCSMTSGESTKKIAPHSMFFNELKTYVRCYDVSRKKFIDIVLNRIDSFVGIDGVASDEMGKKYDDDWNDIISLELVVHPKVVHKKAVENDMQIVGGVKVVSVRKSLAHYWLRRWCVDCSKDASMKDAAYQLHLKNHSVIDCVGGYFPGVNNHTE